MKPNKWLTDSSFLSKVDFHDIYYFETLCRHISNFLKNVPVFSLTTWDPVNKRIYVSVGKDYNKYVSVDTNVSYFDTVTLIKRHLEPFFPKYSIIEDKEVLYTEQEIIDMRNEAISKNEPFDLNDALEMTKIIPYKENGIIEKISIQNDTFILNVNGELFTRISGSLKKPLPLSDFLKKLRKIKGEEKKKNFIFENSSLIKEIDKSSYEIPIEYTGTQMFNFFVINVVDLKDEDFVKVKKYTYKWGKFLIKFDSDILENDCINFLKKKSVNVFTEL